ncbi:MAG: alpha-amylase/alpha-mannosidase, partial [Planctomycetaceae bacterium]
KVDGRHTYFEWISAGHYVSGSERGTMTLVTEGIVREVYFGFDANRLMIRIDTARHAAEDLEKADELRIVFNEPQGFDIRVTGLKQHAPKARLYHDEKPLPRAHLEAAVDQILELTVAFADLELKPDDRIQMHVDLLARKQSVDRAPREGALELVVPSPDFELVMWQA